MDEDIDGTYAEWFESHDVAAVLQRPDFYLFGSASQAGHAGELIDALRAALVPAPHLVPGNPAITDEAWTALVRPLSPEGSSSPAICSWSE